MKAIVPIFTAAALSLLGTHLASAQGSETQAVESAIAAAAEKAQAEARKAREQVEQQLNQLRQQLEQTRQQLRQSGISGSWTGPTLGFRYGLRLPSSPGRVLVISSGKPDAQSVANLEEDLAVMSRVLENAIRPEAGEPGPRRHAMGIEVFTAPPANPLRGLYLDNYGALFMLNVDFPLVPPPARVEEKAEKPPGDSTWDEARRELYGQPDGGKMVVPSFQEYSADKVSQLKDSLLEALKSATNIRGLKPDDWVTLCVFGGASGPSPGPMVHVTRRSAGAATGPGAETEADATAPPAMGERPGATAAPAAGSTLTIRVKKSDVDAFAAGKLSLESFRNKASLSAYAGNSRGAGGRVTADAFSIY